MKFVSAALAACAAIALATPASAQRGGVSSNFIVSVDGAPLTSVRSVTFESTASTSGSNRSAPTLQLTLEVVRSADRTLDKWLADTNSGTRKVAVELKDAAMTKTIGSYDFAGCSVLKSAWSLDATLREIATETWTLSCQGMTRSN